ncbi:sterol desaturase family protein [Pseudomarimonas salicorniae]|uniref:Sterol desaturase family protein n=1 Tax=Pseudomarimonas salicorniae TaxID=2933270 RepID=A0ABT0GLA8_9GAMM|nr:sterol desaturase family protein [Lysobacter sp. CAU 1642]MCK7595326.1 sterol desaturase family protein [Lysobacter sp. CAU 1642]
MEPVLVVAGTAALMIVLEQLAPNVRQPRVAGWIARLVAINAVQIGVVYLGAVSWDAWLSSWRADSLSEWPAPVGIAIGYLLITFVYYWWHRARHEIPWLWRWLHQVHHSPVRIECAMSFYKHPLEILLNGMLSSFVLYVLLGLPVASVAAVVTLTGLAELFYHWNVRTPYLLGFLFQRPEMHRRHHQRGWHRSNYSDLPLWDMLFGTFDNPRATPRHCGFADGAERRLLSMLIGRRPQ